MTIWKFGIYCCAALLSTSSVFAQDSYPRVELFGGFVFGRSTESFNSNIASGWATSLSGNFHKNFGLTADFSGEYGGSNGGFSVLRYAAGPRFTLRGDRATFFVHTLFGARRLHGLEGLRTTKFAMDVGAGIDVRLGPRNAFRVIEFDYVPARQLFNGWANDFQVRTGVVFTFGGRPRR